MKALWLTAFTLLISGTAVATSGRPWPRRVVRPIEPKMALAAWHHRDVRSGGVSKITAGERDSRGGRGSLEQWLADNSQTGTEMEVLSWDTDLDPVSGLTPSHGGFGKLSDLDEVSFEWFRDSSSTAWGHLTPAFRVIVHDPDEGPRGSTWMLTWEGVYNGYANQPGFSVQMDRWVHADITNDNFWRSPLYIDGEFAGRGWCQQNPSECHVYNRGLNGWGFGPNTTIVGLSVAAGSGWVGDYHGFIDLVTLDFRPGNRRTWDFEPRPVRRRRGRR